MHNHPLLLSTGTFYLRDVSECFALAAECGFDGMEILIDDRYTTRDPDYLLKLSKQYHLPVYAMHNPFRWNIPYGSDGSDPLARLEETLALAAVVNAQVVVLHLPARVGFKSVSEPGRQLRRLALTNPDRTLRRWMANGGLKARQEATNIKICVENMPYRPLPPFTQSAFLWNTIEEWSQIHDYLTLDTTHWGTYNIQPIIPLQAAGQRVRHIHLSNFNGEEHRMPEDGTLDLAAVLQYVARCDHELSVTFESDPGAAGYRNQAEMRANLQKAAGFCRQHLPA